MTRNDGSGSDVPRDVEIVERERAFDGYFTVDRLTIRHELYGGGWSPPLVREVLSRGHAVAVLPYDPVRNELVFVEQFRIAAHQAYREGEAQVADTGAWLLECIAGIVEPGEDPLEVAKRESLEEAGCTVDDLMRVRECLTSPGCLTESVGFYCGRTDAADVGGIHGLSSEGENIRVVKLTPDEAFVRLEDGRINNAFTIIAVEWFRANLDDLRKRWGG